jgi:hypothetical protein
MRRAPTKVIGSEQISYLLLELFEMREALDHISISLVRTRIIPITVVGRYDQDRHTRMPPLYIMQYLPSTSFTGPEKQPLLRQYGGALQEMWCCFYGDVPGGDEIRSFEQ